MKYFMLEGRNSWLSFGSIVEGIGNISLVVKQEQVTEKNARTAKCVL